MPLASPLKSKHALSHVSGQRLLLAAALARLSGLELGRLGRLLGLRLLFLLLLRRRRLRYRGDIMRLRGDTWEM